jgi:hypothetical protein
MTSIQRLPPLPGLGSALVLPAGPPGSGPGHPGDATQRGRWRSRVAGPASLALAGAAVPTSAVPRVRRPASRAPAPRAARHPAAGTGVTGLRGPAP